MYGSINLSAEVIFVLPIPGLPSSTGIILSLKQSVINAKRTFLDSVNLIELLWLIAVSMLKGSLEQSTKLSFIF